MQILSLGHRGWEIQNACARFSATLERTRDITGWMCLHTSCPMVLAVALPLASTIAMLVA